MAKKKVEAVQVLDPIAEKKKQRIEKLKKIGGHLKTAGEYSKTAAEGLPKVIDWLLMRVTSPILVSVMNFVSAVLKQSGKVLSIGTILYSGYLIHETYYNTVELLINDPERYMKAYNAVSQSLTVLQSTVVAAVSIGLVFKTKVKGGITDTIKDVLGKK